MSVVANVVSKDGSWTAFDGRAMKDGKIVTENEIKAELINGSVCVGYTGTLEVARAVMSVLHSENNSSVVSKLRSDGIAAAIHKIYAAVRHSESLYAQFLVTGINSNSKFATYTIDKTNSLAAFEPSGDDLLRHTVLSTGDHGLDLQPYLLTEISDRGLNTKSIKISLRKFICDVSKRDPSVNDNVRFITLR